MGLHDSSGGRLPGAAGLQTHHRLATEGVDALIERDGILHFVNGSDLQMILKTMPDPLAVHMARDVVVAEMIARADPRVLKNLR